MNDMFHSFYQVNTNCSMCEPVNSFLLYIRGSAKWEMSQTTQDLIDQTSIRILFLIILFFNKIIISLKFLVSQAVTIVIGVEFLVKYFKILVIY